MSSDKKCCVPNCDSEKEILHKFPQPENDPDRFRTWLYNIGGTILALENDFIFKFRRVCHLHFEPRYHTRSKFLSADAIPTLRMPGPFITRQPPIDSLMEIAPSTSSAPKPPRQESLQYPPASITRKRSFTRQPLVDVTNQTNPVSSTSAQSSVQELREFHVDGVSEMAPSTSKSTQPLQCPPITRKEPNSKAVKKESLVKQVKELRRKNESYRQRLQKALKLSTNVSFQTALKKFKTLAAIFTVMQFREISKPKMGRRFTKEEKVMALSLYKLGPKAYRWLSKIFVLPSPSTLSRIVSNGNLRPGINESIFDQLKMKVNNMNQNARLCTLIFDEMAISPHFQFNTRKDQVSGFVNYTGVSKKKIADHVQVFMIRGVIKNYKQAISYSFSSGSTPKDILALQIKEIIKKLHSIGFVVLATVCDQGTSNTAAINYLTEETRQEYVKQGKELRHYIFEVDGKSIIPLYDVPHLLKGMRNNLLVKNLQYTMDGKVKVAKWDHIMQLYNNNPTYNGLKLVKNLTENHCNKEKIPKMKVKFASQLFSQTVGKTMGYLAENGILPEETKETADFILFMDNLFDSLNGSKTNSTQRSGKDLLLNVTPTSKHKDIWLEAKNVLKSMKFITNTNASGTVPSINNWVKTIVNMELLRDKLFNEYHMKSFWCRHLNQDPLENFFGSIRSHGVRNTSPTCAGFEIAFASLLISNLSSNHSPGSNCEEDFCSVFYSFEKIFFSKNKDKSQLVEFNYDDLINYQDVIVNFELKKRNLRMVAQLQYVTGYILRKVKKIMNKCEICTKELSSDDPNINKYISQREYSRNKKFLCYPSENLTRCFSEMQDVLHHIMRQHSHMNNLKTYMKTILFTIVDTNFLSCDTHKSQINEFIFDFSSRFYAHNWCRLTNKFLIGTSTQKDLDEKDSVQKDANMYFLKRRKIRNKK